MVLLWFLAVWRGMAIPDDASMAEAVCLACCDETQIEGLSAL